MKRRIYIEIVVAGIGAAAISAGSAVAALGAPSQQAGPTSAQSHSYYRSMMAKYDGSSMMGGSNGSGMGSISYESMIGGSRAPGWMSGGTLPGSMMGSSTDPGKVMGRIFANAPGPRVSPTMAARLGGETPRAASVNVANNSVTFSGSGVHIDMIASPSGSADDKFRVAGLIDPAIVVVAGTRVSIEVINADADTSHGLVITTSRSSYSWMPMMTASPAFSGSALWFLGNPTSAGMHSGTIRFTASAKGTYKYLCPVPGHAQKGMVGTFKVVA